MHSRRSSLMCATAVHAIASAVAWMAVGAVADAQAPRPRRVPAPAGFFETPLTPAEMAGRQAVIETTAGTFVVQLLPEAAPNHVGYFMKLAAEGAYTGTTFHRAIRHGIIQGGDPTSRDPGKRALYGTGGLGVLRAEISGEKMTRGAVAAVLQPGKPDSAGAQFFVLVTDQPALEGQYTVFGRVIDGLEMVQQISELATDADGRLTERVEIRNVIIRETPPPEAVPFATESIADLARHRVVLETTLGPITLGFLPDRAPEHVRNFLRLASLGAYDGTAFHRVVRGFVVQGGMLHTRTSPVPQRAHQSVRSLAPEFNDTPHVKGTLSMARLDDPASASTSFFICTGPASSLDGKYTAFGQVVDGWPVLETLDAVAVDGETPRERVEVIRARVERQ